MLLAGLGWAGQSAVRELPVHAKLLGVNVLVTVRPSLPLEKPEGIIPQTMDGTAGTRLSSLLVPGVVMATELHPRAPQDPLPTGPAQASRSVLALHELTQSWATPSSQNLLLPFLQQQLGVGREPGLLLWMGMLACSAPTDPWLGSIT